MPSGSALIFTPDQEAQFSTHVFVHGVQEVMEAASFSCLFYDVGHNVCVARIRYEVKNVPSSPTIKYVPVIGFTS